MNTQELHTKAQEIAKELGFDYFEKKNVNNELSGCASIGTKECHLYVAVVTYGHKKGQLHIAVDWPRNERGMLEMMSQYAIKGRVTGIYVSGAKSSAVIARDIKRRLLADATSLYKEASTTLADWTQFDKDKLLVAESVAHFLGVPWRPEQHENRNPSFYVPHTVHHVTINGPKHITMTLNVESLAECLEILKVVRKEK